MKAIRITIGILWAVIAFAAFPKCEWMTFGQKTVLHCTFPRIARIWDGQANLFAVQECVGVTIANKIATRSVTVGVSGTTAYVVRDGSIVWHAGL